MVNIIPRPAGVKETDQSIWFSEKTNISGEFSEVAELFKNLITKAKDAKPNRLTFIVDTDIAKEGYKILYDDGDINIFALTKPKRALKRRSYLAYQHFANNPYFELELLDFIK